MKDARILPRGSFGKKLRTQFLTGILILAPVAVTALILVWVFVSIDNLLQPFLQLMFGRTVPGTGLFIAVILVYLTGLIAGNVAGRKLVEYAQSLLVRVPIVRPVYSTMKQIIDSFSGSGKTGFTQVVLVEFPRKGMKSIGFVTSEFADKSGRTVLSVYIPASPNPTSGFLQLVSEDEVVRTNIAVNEAMKMVISAGKLLNQEVKDSWTLTT